MQTKTILIILGVFALCLLMCAGCAVGGIFYGIGRVREAADRTKRMNDLREVAMAAHSFHDAHKRMPGNLEDLRPYLFGGAAASRVAGGEIEVVWNALPFKDQPLGTSTVVYAWETKPLSSGDRLVAFMDGSTRMMTESEFQAAAKAATFKNAK